jgi:hypothetical protein
LDTLRTEQERLWQQIIAVLSEEGRWREPDPDLPHAPDR